MESPRKTRFNEDTQTVSFRVPKSKVDDFKAKGHSILAMYSISQYSGVVNNLISEIKEITNNSPDYKDVEAIPKEVVVKEPTRITHKLFGTRSKAIAGYGCLIDVNEVTCYWGDTLSSFLVFDDEKHALAYLSKYKP